MVHTSLQKGSFVARCCYCCCLLNSEKRQERGGFLDRSVGLSAIRSHPTGLCIDRCFRSLARTPILLLALRRYMLFGRSCALYVYLPSFSFHTYNYIHRVLLARKAFSSSFSFSSSSSSSLHSLCKALFSFSTQTHSPFLLCTYYYIILWF